MKSTIVVHALKDYGNQSVCVCVSVSLIPLYILSTIVYAKK